ncbi:hypothetical protein [Niallia sp. 03133]|uniref:hypothetical protein n=1 Tax=Niallia sp. 03133 TaxID=3458060 RepID=UPI004044C97E
MKRFADYLILIFFLTYVFSALIQYLVSFVGASSLIVFAKNIIPVIVLLICLINMLKNNIIYTKFALILIILLFCTLIGILNNLPIIQIIFGIKAVIPLLSLYLYIVNFKPKINFVMWYRILVPLVAIGIVLDKFLTLPWSSLVFSIGGLEREVSRQWNAFGIERLAGFQASSVDSGTILSLLILFRFTTIFVGIKQKFNIYDILILLIGLYCIYLTTFKSAYIYILFLLIITLSFKLHKYSPWFQLVTKFSMLVALAYCIVPPALSIFMKNFKLDFTNSSFIYQYLFTSYGMRITSTWPLAVQLLDGSIANGYFGRGIGGIGTAQKFGEMTRYAFADNLFVYLYVSIGTITLLIVLFMLKVILFNKDSNDKSYLSFSLILLVLIFGATTDFIESVLLMSVIGLILGEYSNLSLKDTLSIRQEKPLYKNNLEIS